jgi:hypothetical protein
MSVVPSTTQSPSIAEVFARQGFVLVNRLAPPPMVALARQYLETRVEEGTIILDDVQVPSTPCVYGGLLDGLMEELRPRIEFCCGLKLFPTYSYGRLYKHGDVLAPHRDRVACEISVSVNLGQSPEDPWALYLRAAERDVPILLRPGDALLYRGTELTHWREPFHGEKLAQIFFHYVDQAGPHAEEKFDRRPALAMPFGTRPVRPKNQ